MAHILWFHTSYPAFCWGGSSIAMKALEILRERHGFHGFYGRFVGETGEPCLVGLMMGYHLVMTNSLPWKDSPIFNR